MKSSIISFAVLASTVAAVPLTKRQDNIDAVILNYALTLEHLEAEFYAQGIKNITEAEFTKAGFTGKNFYNNLMEVARDEKTHVDFLSTALKAAGASPVAACTYDFGNLGPKSFMETASILEGVGVSAYLGAAQNITNKAYLTAAASILTVEARHSSYIRGSLAKSPFAAPFDIPLDFSEVYSLAAPFIVSCPSTNAKLPVQAFPVLTATSAMPAIKGKIVSYAVAAGTTIPSGQLYIGFPLVTGPVFSPVVMKDGKMTAAVPTSASLQGQTYAILTTSNTSITDDNTVAGPAIVNVLVNYWT